MDELIKEWALTAKTIRAYLEWRFKLEGGEELIKTATKTAEVTIATPEARKPGRPSNKAKAEFSKTVKDALAEVDGGLSLDAAVEKTTVPALSDKETLDFCYKLAADYLSKGDKDIRAQELREYLTQTYEKPRIAALSPDERIEFAGYLQGKTAETVEI